MIFAVKNCISLLSWFMLGIFRYTCCELVLYILVLWLHSERTVSTFWVDLLTHWAKITLTLPVNISGTLTNFKLLKFVYGRFWSYIEKLFTSFMLQMFLNHQIVHPETNTKKMFLFGSWTKKFTPSEDLPLSDIIYRQPSSIQIQNICKSIHKHITVARKVRFFKIQESDFEKKKSWGWELIKLNT